MGFISKSLFVYESLDYSSFFIKTSMIRCSQTFHLLENFQQTYTNSVIEDKKKLISSIFPEIIEFDGKKCRTKGIKDVVSYKYTSSHLIIKRNKSQKK